MTSNKQRKAGSYYSVPVGPDGFENEAAEAQAVIRQWTTTVKVLLDCRESLAWNADHFKMEGEQLVLIEQAKKSLGPKIAEAMRARDAAQAVRDDVDRRRIEAARVIGEQRDRTHDQGPIFEAAYAGVREMIEQSKGENHATK
jgi:hypothetical protein